MILDVLVFALGFMVAWLLALAALPAVWRRALRLSEERLSRLVPLSADEIAAERDHLRAAHAVAVRRLEQKLDDTEAGRSALRVEAARREDRIAALDEAAIRAQVRIAERDAELAGLRREAAELWAERGAEALALDGLARLAERRLEDAAVGLAERDALREEVDRHRTSLAGLETRLIGAETRGGDLERALAAARRDAAAEAEATAARLAAEREGAAARAVEATQTADGIQTAAERAADDRAHEIESLKAELAFMAEQALSAERRAAESLKACEALKTALATMATMAAAAPVPTIPAVPAAPSPPRDDAALRAAVSTLADELMRAVSLPNGAA